MTVKASQIKMKNVSLSWLNRAIKDIEIAMEERNGFKLSKSLSKEHYKSLEDAVNILNTICVTYSKKEKIKKVPNYLSNICPYCFYIHRPDEGSTQLNLDTGRVDFTCVNCGKDYYWMQYKIETPEGKHITKELYNKLKA